MTRTRLALASLTTAAVTLAIPARIQAEDFWGVPDIKQLLCGSIGCYNGDRECGSISGEIKNPLGTANLSISLKCYEKTPARPSGGEWEM